MEWTGSTRCHSSFQDVSHSMLPIISANSPLRSHTYATFSIEPTVIVLKVSEGQQHIKVIYHTLECGKITIQWGKKKKNKRVQWI